ncbi:hypothetical protein N780_07600 [Pontibacillus chungwhensis BH030062]|uniref:Uncharacterized protein n=1 Tax=Pontibacillus chungwhensis BH030062 TaxID=1385513 RepID=A0A0A2UU10_9BACI|nr:hypothetical protein [Pontibacillus chungwhensis]KGP89986.1 hypothetical protein N780_07600 [Pontibacillus chungwhensis BH030062]
MKNLLRSTLSSLLIGLGFLTGIFAFAYKMLILSDIPVSFSNSEAFVAQVLFFTSTTFISFGILAVKSDLGRVIAAGFIMLALLFNLPVFHTPLFDHMASVAFLQITPILHLSFLTLLSLYLLIRNWKQPLYSYN